ncbi:thiaminase II [Paracoccus aminophilus]|uniref:Aminopyrimidine aminohydrolase n=1 Tax=Paracoccus aminophilus JCM 7686 TaxID=1367847 RepID=S5Y7B1_PARAH|nr:thiaminase II [Paracoccus aminophilus]AGT07218.1 transcription regulator, TenA family [Paracoccus aminophilus JCM 7686]
MNSPDYGPDYGQAFAAWRKDCASDWHDYTRHAFVEGLGSGALPRADFLTYLQQDYVFLIHFSRAWALAVVKAGNFEEMRACSATVHTLLDGEMALHVGICEAAGISRATLEATVEAIPNLAYTRYVLDSGFSGDFLDVVAALAPCVLGYGEIGLRLAREAAPDTPYRDWIDTYAGEDYQKACHAVGALLDSAIARRLGPDAHSLPRWRELSQRFATATRLEVGFWGLGRA